MKKFQSMLIVAAGMVSLSAAAGSHQFVAGDNSKETKICLAAVTDDLNGYRKAVKNVTSFTPGDSRAHRIVANDLSCNDENVAKFARKYGADKTATFISRYLNRSVDIRRDVVESAKPDKDTVIVVTAD